MDGRIFLLSEFLKTWRSASYSRLTPHFLSSMASGESVGNVFFLVPVASRELSVCPGIFLYPLPQYLELYSRSQSTGTLRQRLSGLCRTLCLGSFCHPTLQTLQRQRLGLTFFCFPQRGCVAKQQFQPCYPDSLFFFFNKPSIPYS